MCESGAHAYIYAWCKRECLFGPLHGPHTWVYIYIYIWYGDYNIDAFGAWFFTYDQIRLCGNVTQWCRFYSSIRGGTLAATGRATWRGELESGGNVTGQGCFFFFLYSKSPNYHSQFLTKKMGVSATNLGLEPTEIPDFAHKHGGITWHSQVKVGIEQSKKWRFSFTIFTGHK